MKAIVVSVDFGDLLAITLPHNATHFDEVLVVTSPADAETIEVAGRTSNVRVFQTNAFYRQGAIFNKGLAMEEGFGVLGRDGWIVVWDADTLMPKNMDVGRIEPGNLYSPRRRICFDPGQWQESWEKWPIYPEAEFAGYFQLFHASDPVLESRPWYGTQWRHAGGCDSDFEYKWPLAKKRRLPFEVLHLGAHGQNWCGRQTTRLDGRQAAGATRARKLYGDLFVRRQTEGIGAWEKIPAEVE